MEMIFHSHANKTHFQKKGCALGLILKVRVFELGCGLFMGRHKLDTSNLIDSNVNLFMYLIEGIRLGT